MNKRPMRKVLGYPDPPVVGPNSTQAGYLREIERWRSEMVEALELDINTVEYMRRKHPDWNLSADFERKALAWVRAFPNGGPPPVPPGYAERAP